MNDSRHTNSTNDALSIAGKTPFRMRTVVGDLNDELLRAGEVTKEAAAAMRKLADAALNEMVMEVIAGEEQSRGADWGSW